MCIQLYEKSNLDSVSEISRKFLSVHDELTVMQTINGIIASSIILRGTQTIEGLNDEIFSGNSLLESDGPSIKHIRFAVILNI